MMAAAFSSDETESFVTCSVCLWEFDSRTRKPKFLPCAHTICLKCLKEIHKENYIICPLCRREFFQMEDVSNLPNNSYALHMIKLTDKSSLESVVNTDSQGKPSWCLTCNKASIKDCCSTHSIIDVTAKTVKNFESLLKLRDDIRRMKEQGQNNLALAIEKRKEIQAYLTQLSLSLNMALAEVNQQEDENNTQLMEMVSLLESSSSHLNSIVPAQKISRGHEDPLLSELISFVDDSKPEDSLETLKEKMKKSIKVSEQRLATATAMASKLQNQKKSKISIRVTDSKNNPVPMWDLLTSGFNIYWAGETSLTPTRRDFMLLSYIVFSIQKRGQSKHGNSFETGAPLKSDKPVVPLDSQTSFQAPECSTKNVPAVIPVEQFSKDNLMFVISVRRNGAIKGEIHIKLSPSCDSLFSQQLSKNCFRSPKPVGDKIGKTIPDGFLMIPAYRYFCEFSPKWFENLKDAQQVCRYMEVGISLTKDEKNKKTGCWSFVFPLTYFAHKRYNVDVKTIQPVHLFGRVVQGIDVVELLSYTTKQQRDSYTFMLESR